ncbi:MAG: hypothetical protein HY719_06065 [Planctomycetes bacterium]|nr:hypothetical protein [Planctomycetota bacterium]
MSPPVPTSQSPHLPSRGAPPDPHLPISPSPHLPTPAAGEARAVAEALARGLFARFSPLGAESLLWHGGFARGEAAFLSGDGFRLPWGDYDFAVVSRRFPPRRAVAAAIDEVAARVRPGVNVDVTFVHPRDLLHPAPDLSNFDLLAGSTLLAGRPPRMAAPPAYVSPISPLRIIVNRLCVTLLAFRRDAIPAPGAAAAANLHFLIDKTYVALGAAETVLLGTYHPSPATRLSRLRAAAPPTASPRVLDRIAGATERKTRPGEGLGEPPLPRMLRAWGDSVPLIRRLLAAAGAPAREAKEGDLPRLFLARLPALYYRDFIRCALPRPLRFGLPVWSRAAAWHEDLLTRLHACHEARQWTRSRAVAPIHRCAAAAALLYDSVDDHGRVIALDLAARAGGVLDPAVLVRPRGGEAGAIWNAAREAMARLWILYTRRYWKRSLRDALPSLARAIFER